MSGQSNKMPFNLSVGASEQALKSPENHHTESICHTIHALYVYMAYMTRSFPKRVKRQLQNRHSKANAKFGDHDLEKNSS